jgi:hypothetical protein
MSFWTDIRDTVESVAVPLPVIIFCRVRAWLPRNWLAKVHKTMLGSDLGQIAMLGSGVAGGVGGNLSNYGKFYDAAGNFASGGENALSNLFSTGIRGSTVKYSCV